MASVASSWWVKPLSISVQPSGVTGVRSRSMARMAMSRSPTAPAGVATTTSWGLLLSGLTAVSLPTNSGVAESARRGWGGCGSSKAPASTASDRHSPVTGPTVRTDTGVPANEW